MIHNVLIAAIKKYQIKQEIWAIIACFCIVLDYSSFASSELSGRQHYE